MGSLTGRRVGARNSVSELRDSIPARVQDIVGRMVASAGGSYNGAEGTITLPGGAVSELSGTGTPNGVITASPGTYYTDTAGTNGAWRWLKTSGTGNTGWEVVHGDTRWRDVTASAINHPGIASGAIRIRRIGEMSFVRIFNLQFSSDHTTGSGPLFVLPPGFAFGPISGLAARSNGLASTTNIALTSTGQLFILSRNTDTPANIIPGMNWPLAGMLSGPTAQPWPTTLPGTPA